MTGHRLWRPKRLHIDAVLVGGTALVLLAAAVHATIGWRTLLHGEALWPLFIGFVGLTHLFAVWKADRRPSTLVRVLTVVTAVVYGLFAFWVWFFNAVYGPLWMDVLAWVVIFRVILNCRYVGELVRSARRRSSATTADPGEVGRG